MGKFDELVTIEEWKRALDELLDRARVLSSLGTEIAEVLDDLRAFIKASPGKCDFLDKIAFKAGSDLADAEINRRIASIAARKQDIETEMKKLTAATDDLKKAQSELQFEQIIKSLQLSTAIVDEITELRAALSDEEKAALDKAIAVAKTVDDIQKLLKKQKVTS